VVCVAVITTVEFTVVADGVVRLVVLVRFDVTTGVDTVVGTVVFTVVFCVWSVTSEVWVARSLEVPDELSDETWEVRLPVDPELLPVEIRVAA
jgi:hypothetical protein